MFVQADFAGEVSIDVEEVGRHQQHPGDEPYQSHLQPIGRGGGVCDIEAQRGSAVVRARRLRSGFRWWAGWGCAMEPKAAGPLASLVKSFRLLFSWLEPLHPAAPIRFGDVEISLGIERYGVTVDEVADLVAGAAEAA